jgi:hypothetical protein
MGRLQCEIVVLTSLILMSEARKKMGASQVLLGDLKPVTVVCIEPPTSHRRSQEAHQAAGHRYIVELVANPARHTGRELKGTLLLRQTNSLKKPGRRVTPVEK